MKFHSLAISNFRAIKQFSIEDLGSFVVIAGQNGCGKSCVLDSLRLLKSAYGGYAANEYQQWFGEFQINLADLDQLRTLFRDPSHSIRIQASLSFTDDEVIYMSGNAERLLQPIAWQNITGQVVDSWNFSQLAFASQMPQYREQMDTEVSALSSNLHASLVTPRYTLSLEILNTGQLNITPCLIAQIAFQAYQPTHLGVLEYHSASRSYTRQQVGGINLDARAFEDQQRQQTLYNWQSKYQNVKTELASSYLRNIIAQESGAVQQTDDLNETLRELFHTFFPDKTYEGVQPQEHGSLRFPVRLSSGEEHDIDDLSSGEKEILYGYLKLKNSTPRNSVILLDEPELHLNPSLLQGFPDFYYRHLGVAQGNQLWLVTHSDTLLRQAVGNTNYRVFQMVPATSMGDLVDQAVEVVADDDVERVTIELVGDLASYRPHGKVVILEGRSEDGFDVTVIKRLFPDFARRVNLVGGGSKRRVRDLRSALAEAAEQAGIRNRFFAIVDKDYDVEEVEGASENLFRWDAYHIENYLLDPGSIRAAIHSLTGSDPFTSDEDVLEALRSCASELVDRFVLTRMQDDLNSTILKSVLVKGPPDTTDPAGDLMRSIERSLERVSELSTELTADSLAETATTLRSLVETSLQDGSWIRQLPGRDILGRFTGSQVPKVSREIFTNVVLEKMVERAVQPEAMKAIFDVIGSA